MLLLLLLSSSKGREGITDEATLLELVCGLRLYWKDVELIAAALRSRCCLSRLWAEVGEECCCACCNAVTLASDPMDELSPRLDEEVGLTKLLRRERSLSDRLMSRLARRARWRADVGLAVASVDC